MAIAYLGLGSNGQDRAGALQEAARRLESAGISIEAVSPVFETSPVDCEGPPFYNAVARVATILSPSGLLNVLLETERAMGRKPGESRGAPRPIDLDLLLYDDLVFRGPGLVLPHPRMTARRFVLEPLSSLAPDLLIPGQRHGVAVLAEKLARSALEQKVRLVRGVVILPGIKTE